MTDPRHATLAQTLITYSLAIQPGDRLLINAPTLAAPLVREVYRAALRAGAHPELRITLDDLEGLLLSEGSDTQLSDISPQQQLDVDGYAATLRIGAPENTRALAGIDPARLARFNRARAPLSQRRAERAASGALRWCYTIFPTNALAQEAGLSLAEYEDFVYGAMLLDRPDPAAAWREVHTTQARIITYLEQRETIRIVAPGTDLTYRIAGRRWNNSSGGRNFPSGEVFTGPIEDSVEGTVSFTHPAIRDGVAVEGVRLTFDAGRVVEATATRGEAYLHAMLDTDPGARYLGEVAFGLNYGITRFTRNTLFDEKIGGTMHIALGQSYPDTGGVNQSAIHWDLISDLHEGEVYADGERCYERGHFTI